MGYSFERWLHGLFCQICYFQTPEKVGQVSKIEFVKSSQFSGLTPTLINLMITLEISTFCIM